MPRPKTALTKGKSRRISPAAFPLLFPNELIAEAADFFPSFFSGFLLNSRLNPAQRTQWHKPAFRRLLFQHHFAIELRHLRIFRSLLRRQRQIAFPDLLFTRCLRNPLVVQ